MARTTTGLRGVEPRCTLLVYIDDATRADLGELWFVGHESFFGYAEATRHYLARYGRPVAFYSDKHGIFRVNQGQGPGTGAGITQFGRAMQELDIQIVCANTPQAKGRVERANQTLQDRLVKELRLAGISDPADRQCLSGELSAGFQPPLCGDAAQQPRCPSPAAGQRRPGTHPEPSGDPHADQEPDRAV